MGFKGDNRLVKQLNGAPTITFGLIPKGALSAEFAASYYKLRWSRLTHQASTIPAVASSTFRSATPE